MKQSVILLLLLCLNSPLKAQVVKNLLNNSPAGRIDTIIRLGATELESIPLIIMKGVHKGPTFTIIAGVHGYEYPPIMAVQQLMHEIKPENLHGNMIIVPMANRGAFYNRAPFVNPLDDKNLNNAFPGAAGGTITEKIANWITREIIPNSGVFLDIHGGDANEDLLPFICYYNNTRSEPQTHEAQLLCEASGMKYIVSYPYTLTATQPAKYAFKQAVQNECVALSIEAGKLGTVQLENVALIKGAVYNMLNYKGIYNTHTTAKKNKKHYLCNQEYIKVPVRGIFYSPVKSGATVKKGGSLGYITNEFGKVTARITAPVNGIVLYKIGTPPVNAGETLFCIGY